MTYSTIGMFSGAGGLDLGFEQAGFNHLASMDWDPWSIATLQKNRPEWDAQEADAVDWMWGGRADVLLAGPPCQGYSLGGNRNAGDQRNQLYRQVLRVAATLKPRVVVIENVLNMRTLIHPETQRPFVEQVATDLVALGYDVRCGVFRMDGFGVPQTRRRWIFVAFRGSAPEGYQLPEPYGSESIRPWLIELGSSERSDLPNHKPEWGFKSNVHVETGEPFDPTDQPVVVRFSRTASDGNPVRSFDQPFPAVDTATIWGWAQGNLVAKRVKKDRSDGAKFIRSKDSDLTLWRITASRLRAMTHREYARLQTFPDTWEFVGNNKRDIQLQIGNAVPVEFARRLGANILEALDALDHRRPVRKTSGQVPLF